MGRHFSYSDPEYRKKQAEITKKYWRLGTFDFKVKPKIELTCQNPKCSKCFYVEPHNSLIRKYCSRSCSAIVNSPGRIMPEVVKLKISQALKGSHPHVPPTRFAHRLEVVCQNDLCKKVMFLPPWLAKRRVYCSTACAMKVIGSQTTSPKASRGISGIRKDINSKICFYSTWEANIARIFNLIGIKWVYAPKIFDLGEHTYRPDFYLPELDTYIEVKNFMGEYSLNRDKQFRKLYPNIKLDLILKKEYVEIKANYKYFIKNWEY